MSTSELKLRRTQLEEEIAQPVGFRMAGFHPGTEDHDSLFREKRKIEFELLRRCEAGDKAACLPSFRQ
jgi:hypothetical protein